MYKNHRRIHGSINMRVSPNLILGVLSSGAALFNKLIPRNENVYRVEDPSGKTIGIFSTYKKASKLGSPIKDVLDPKVYPYWVYIVNPLNEVVEEELYHSREKLATVSGVVGLDGLDPLTLIVVSNRSLENAKDLSKSLFNEFIENIEVRIDNNALYTYGRLKSGETGYGIIWGIQERLSLYAGGDCGISKISFQDAKQKYESMFD